MFSSASAFIVAWAISDQKKLFGEVFIEKFTAGDIPFYIILGLLTGLSRGITSPQLINWKIDF